MGTCAIRKKLNEFAKLHESSSSSKVPIGEQCSHQALPLSQIWESSCKNFFLSLIVRLSWLSSMPVSLLSLPQRPDE